MGTQLPVMSEMTEHLTKNPQSTPGIDINIMFCPEDKIT